MISFVQSSSVSQSLVMIFLFLTMLLFLFQVITLIGRHNHRGWNVVHLSGFAALFILLVQVQTAYQQIQDGRPLSAWANTPMWLLWSIGIAVDSLLLLEALRLHKTKACSLGRDSIKEGMDQLPIGICYFTSGGVVKLCNLQMHRLFRTLAGRDLQQLKELQEALECCGSETRVVCISKERQTYRFPDGMVWRYRESQVTDSSGIFYTEAVFSDITEQYHRNLELQAQTEKLKEVSRKLRRLSENVLILAKEREVLTAKTKLHDQMGAGLTAARKALQQQTLETADSVRLLRQAVSAVKRDNAYPPEKNELAKFLQDAHTIGVQVHLSGELPEHEEAASAAILAMRECLTNGVRHAGATELWIELREADGCILLRITNDGVPPEREIVPKGGLHNLYRCVMDCGGEMKIQSRPTFALTITLPKQKEEMV